MVYFSLQKKWFEKMLKTLKYQGFWCKWEWNRPRRKSIKWWKRCKIN